MGFNKCILPSIETMQFQIKRDGLKEFVRIYRKYDSISGDSERIQFLEKKIFEYEDNTISDNNISGSNRM
jgi:hypothetical protein